MKRLSFKAAVILMAILLIGAGCSKEKSTSPTSPSPSNNNSPPALDVDQVTLPQGLVQSQDPMAQMVVGYVNMANSFAQYTALVSPPSGNMAPDLTSPYSGPPWVYTWDVNNGPDDTYTITLTIDETDTTYTWNVMVSGVVGGVTVSDFKYVEGLESKDGSSGYLFIYDPETHNMAARFDWAATSDNQYTLHYTVPGSVMISITVNPDDSGSINYYEWDGSDFIPMFQAHWNADGSGEWWTYDSNGDVSGHGTWS